MVMGQGHPRRIEAERVIERVYLEAFGARLLEHFPILIAVTNTVGDIAGAAGCRIADQSTLFLEQYLDEPIERALARFHLCDTPREAIAEIGSLATIGDGAALPLFSALAHHLHEAGVLFATATVTRRLRRAFRTFGFGPRELVKASPARLRESAECWGDYYNHDPVVVVGSVTAGYARLGGIAAGPHL